MNENEDRLPTGTRVKITEEYGGSNPLEVYKQFHGLEGTVLPYEDVAHPYIRIKLDNPPAGEDWAYSMLMLSDEIERV